MDFINFILSNGRSTGSLVAPSTDGLVKYKLAYASANHWSVTENSQNNAWNVNFNDGNTNNNNKYNTNRVRAVVALDDEVKEGWIVAKNDCCANKKSSPQCDAWRCDYEMDLWMLVYQVYSRTYKPITSTCFLVKWPKLREIFAAAFRDRIVQHWVCLRLEPLFEARFKAQGDVSFNCRKGYGTLKAVEALRADIVEVSQNYTIEKYVGRFDLVAFFMTIDRQVLWDLLKPFIIENYKGDDIDTLLYLTEIIVFHNPQFDCKRNSPMHLWKDLPKSKSLFYLPPGVGMAIGNLTSQLFANFYMSYFDEFMIWLCARYGCKYRRFVDDFTIVGDKKVILKLRPLAEAYLRKRLHVTLHQDKFYLQPVRHGIKFVGSVIMPGRTYISNRTVGGLIDELQRTEEVCDLIAGGCDDIEAAYKELRHCVSSINSYIGFLVHCNSYRLRMSLLLNMSRSFWECCYITGDLRCVKIKEYYLFPNFLRRKEAYIYGISL